MCIVISIGKWGNVYWYRGFGLRLCLGWVAITFLPVDGDFILEQAAEQINAAECPSDAAHEEARQRHIKQRERVEKKLGIR